MKKKSAVLSRLEHRYDTFLAARKSGFRSFSLHSETISPVELSVRSGSFKSCSRFCIAKSLWCHVWIFRRWTLALTLLFRLISWNVSLGSRAFMRWSPILNMLSGSGIRLAVSAGFRVMLYAEKKWRTSTELSGERSFRKSFGSGHWAEKWRKSLQMSNHQCGFRLRRKSSV